MLVDLVARTILLNFSPLPYHHNLDYVYLCSARARG